jgi:hypothetical protein
MQLSENHGLASPSEGLKPSHSSGVNVSARVLARYMAGHHRVES